ncbi:hypothetical protein [Marinomonas shanghaiensis]|uniref:hypothetical protein n=1 Tax=Marinomonas shanghaiensis TaxID=2202418 RepID=UPI003A931320
MKFSVKSGVASTLITLALAVIPTSTTALKLDAGIAIEEKSSTLTSVDGKMEVSVVKGYRFSLSLLTNDSTLKE